MNKNSEILDRRDFFIIILGLVGNICYSVLDETEILGTDKYYYIYWHFLPFFISYCILLPIYYGRLKKLNLEDNLEKTLKQKKEMRIGVFIIPALITFIAINLSSISLWTEYNKFKSRHNKSVLEKVKLYDLYSRKSKYRLKIEFKNNYEYLKVDYKEYLYAKQKLKAINVELVLDVTKSYGNYWILNSWVYKE